MVLGNHIFRIGIGVVMLLTLNLANGSQVIFQNPSIPQTGPDRQSFQHNVTNSLTLKFDQMKDTGLPNAADSETHASRNVTTAELFKSTIQL